MSHNRDLKNAQRQLNDTVRTWVAHRRQVGIDWQTDAVLLMAWQNFAMLQDQIDGDAAASARDTSIAAAKANLPSIVTLRGTVCEAMFVAGKVRYSDRYDEHAGGMTCDELERKLRRKHQSVSSAVNYAETHGWIKDSGQRRYTSSGSKAIVYEPTDRLIEKVAERRRVA